MDTIDNLLKQGLSCRKIGKLLGIHHSTVIYRINKGKTQTNSNYIKEGQDSICKTCGRQYKKNRKKGHKGETCNSCSTRQNNKKLRNITFEIVGNKCCKCGYNSCLKVLEFHHVNSQDKSFTISSGINRKSEKDIIKECYKCITFCANCHREYHAGLFNYNNINIENLKDYQINLLYNCQVSKRANEPSSHDGTENPNK